MDSGDAFFVEARGIVDWERELGIFAVSVGRTVEGAVLGFGAFMLEALQKFLDVAWHGDVDGALVVVPVEADSTIKFAVPVDVQGVMFLESFEQVVGMLFSDIFDTEVIYDEGKTDGTGDVFPQAWGVGYFVVPMLGEALGEELVGEFSCLW